MRRKLTWGKKHYRADNRLGAGLVKAEEIADQSVAMQVLVIVPGRKVRLLTMRACGRSRMTATDEASGVTTAIPSRVAWTVANAAGGG